MNNISKGGAWPFCVLNRKVSRRLTLKYEKVNHLLGQSKTGPCYRVFNNFIVSYVSYRVSFIGASTLASLKKKKHHLLLTVLLINIIATRNRLALL